jgi:hypothetical protein
MTRAIFYNCGGFLLREKMADVEALASHPLNTEEMEQILKSFNLDVPIMLYSDLFPRADLAEYLDSLPNKAVIILFRADTNFGHWVTVFLKNHMSGNARIADTSNLYVFDSLGLCVPDDWKRLMGQTKTKAEELGQDKRALIQSCLNSGFKSIYWNEFPIQSPSPEIQTCGRHCIMRLLRPDLSPKQYFNTIRYAASRNISPLINGQKKGAGTQYDYLATALTDPSYPYRADLLLTLGIYYI